jgi:regulatory protein
MIDNNEDLNTVKEFALSLLDKKPYSISQIKDKLKKKNFNDDIIEKVINDLLRVNLLNDYEFAKDWIETRKKSKKLGIIRLKNELQKRGIEESVIEQSIKDSNLDKDEFTEALKLANKIFLKYKNIDANKMKYKISGFLQRRGYSDEIIEEVIQSIFC